MFLSLFVTRLFFFFFPHFGRTLPKVYFLFFLIFYLFGRTSQILEKNPPAIQETPVVLGSVVAMWV